MAFIQCQFYSTTLALSSSVNVVLPETVPGKSWSPGTSPEDGRFPVLWLLHGLSDDHSIWMRRTSIERYAVSRGIAVVMPAVGRSFYLDMAQGARTFTYVRDELQDRMRAWFPLAADRERNFIAGLSMGGYGAFLHAMTDPGRYAAAASLSGALDMRRRAFQENGPFNPGELRSIFGEPEAVDWDSIDLFRRAPTIARRRNPKPRFYACCGTEDFLLDDNRRFRDHAAEVGLQLTYEETPGAHDWGYWDQGIQRVLDWLPLPGR